jgi:hypothetical protein
MIYKFFWVCCSFQMENDHVSARIADSLHPFTRFVNHQMNLYG